MTLVVRLDVPQGTDKSVVDDAIAQLEELTKKAFASLGGGELEVVKLTEVK
jgi:hypothetical protein